MMLTPICHCERAAYKMIQQGIMGVRKAANAAAEFSQAAAAIREQLAHLRPILPVKQNWQFMAQPTWDEMHRVVRGRRPWLRTTGISTVSTSKPAPSPVCSRVTFLWVSGGSAPVSRLQHRELSLAAGLQDAPQ